MDPILGSIILFAGTFVPRGWADCNGAILPIAQNQALFSLLGITYGGNGTTTFALPDLRGRVPVGIGQGPGLTNHTLGEMAGVETVTLTTNQIPAHTHTISAGNLTVTLKAANTSGQHAAPLQGDFIGVTTDGSTDYPAFVTNPPAANQITLGGVTSSLAGIVIGSTGGSQPHTNMQPYLGMRYIIATEGIYPTRP